MSDQIPRASTFGTQSSQTMLGVKLSARQTRQRRRRFGRGRIRQPPLPSDSVPHRLASPRQAAQTKTLYPISTVPASPQPMQTAPARRSAPRASKHSSQIGMVIGSTRIGEPQRPHGFSCSIQSTSGVSARTAEPWRLACGPPRSPASRSRPRVAAPSGLPSRVGPQTRAGSPAGACSTRNDARSRVLARRVRTELNSGRR